MVIQSATPFSSNSVVLAKGGLVHYYYQHLYSRIIASTPDRNVYRMGNTSAEGSTKYSTW